MGPISSPGLLSSATPKVTGSLIIQLGRLSVNAGALGKKQANPWVARFVRNLAANDTSTTLRNLELNIDEVNEAVIYLTRNNPNASHNIKAVQSWLKTVGSFKRGGNAKISLLGYLQEMQLIARKAAAGASIQVKHSLGVLDAVIIEGGKRIAYESKFLAAGDEISDTTKRRVVDHLRKHVETMLETTVDEVRLIAHSEGGAKAIKEFVEKSDKYKAMNDAIGIQTLKFESLTPRANRKWSVD
jgi:hypothetical protein